METKLYRINGLFARENKLPVYFVANKLVESARAVYLHGRGTTETVRMGRCCICGRELTHPVSVELGIGPECGGHYWDWNAIGGYTKENIERLKGELVNIEVNSWVPKSCVMEILDTKDVVQTSKDHPILNRQPKQKVKKATQVRYQKTGQDAIKIEFPFDRTVVEQVKTIPGRRFHVNEKYWSSPLSIEAVEKLKELEFDLDPKLEIFLNKSKINVKDVAEITVPGLKGTLFPFQSKGVAFIEAKNGRALIADEMGLGKTIQALGWLQLHPEKRPVIIVCPASLKLNWAKEITAWMGVTNVQILSGTNTNVPLIGEIMIINYDILENWVDVLSEIHPQVIIFDEVHYIKNNQAKRTKAGKKLGRLAPHVIALSGTPIVNRPAEMLNAIRLIDQSVVPLPWEYLQRYCGAKHNGFGWDFTGATNTEELHEKLVNSIMIRRMKKDVLTDLPDKIRAFTPMELNNQKEYNAAERDFINFVREQKGAAAAEKASNAQALAEIEGLKQLAVQGKLKQSIEWIKDFIEVDGKLVVFAVHKFVIDALMQEFSNIAVKIDGSVTGVNRDKAVTEFQNNPNIRLFIGNIKAAGVGLTLTAASNVAFLELPWTPGDVTQAEDRCHRIGQKDSVTIHYLLAGGTIEEKIAELIDTKRKVLDAVLDGKDTESESLLSELMNEYDV